MRINPAKRISGIFQLLNNSGTCGTWPATRCAKLCRGRNTLRRIWHSWLVYDGSCNLEKSPGSKWFLLLMRHQNRNKKYCINYGHWLRVRTCFTSDGDWFYELTCNPKKKHRLYHHHQQQSEEKEEYNDTSYSGSHSGSCSGGNHTAERPTTINNRNDSNSNLWNDLELSTAELVRLYSGIIFVLGGVQTKIWQTWLISQN